VLAAALGWLAWFMLPLVAPDFGMFGMFGAIGSGLVIVLWWLFFSRAPWSDRAGVLVLMVAGVFATSRVVHESISNGMMGMMLPVYSIPVLTMALVASAAASRRLSIGRQRASMAAAILLACAGFTLVRTGGITGGGDSDLHWRWTPTPEERLLAEADLPIDSGRGEPSPAPSAPAAPAPAGPEKPVTIPGTAPAPGAAVPAAEEHSREPASPYAAESATSVDPADANAGWPGFRGPNRDGVVRGIQIDTDWSKSPPVELWRRPIGPGWSSFAVRGDRLYTQEQRGEDEVVSCYSLITGDPVWRHGDAARFWESNGGAGPRATPTLRGDRLYTLGATGIVNVLNVRDGSVVWSRNASSDTGAENPGWGFAGSPLVVGDLVIVAASGRLVAYDIATGRPRWFGPANGAGYSSPHLVTIDGVPQILLLRGARSTSVAPGDGTVLWEYSWQPGVSIVQPAVTANGDVLIVSADAMGGVGLRRITAKHGSAGWTVEEHWTSRGLKPFFNDFVVHKDHAFGFDGNILASIDLADGQRKWKGGRYGNGQVVLLADQDVLLVLSEEGELALVRAAPDQFTEMARFPALDGKTWNHPVLAGDVLLVRNGEEMAAFRLSLTGR
jgi:outer membrane protein assembly factor BamB